MASGRRGSGTLLGSDGLRWLITGSAVCGGLGLRPADDLGLVVSRQGVRHRTVQDPLQAVVRLSQVLSGELGVPLLGEQEETRMSHRGAGG